MTEGKKPGDRARKSSGRGQRDLRVRVKSAKGRKLSSTLWLERQLNDPYVARARREGYRGRAAYKILELDDKYGFLVPGARVVDLGAAPGGWSQVAVARVNALGERGGKQGQARYIGQDQQHPAVAGPGAASLVVPARATQVHFSLKIEHAGHSEINDRAGFGPLIGAAAGSASKAGGGHHAPGRRAAGVCPNSLRRIDGRAVWSISRSRMTLPPPKT